MKHLRKDYDAIQPFPVKRPHHVKINDTLVMDLDKDWLESQAQPLIPDDEPVFLLRGQDPASWRAVLAYAQEALNLGADPNLVDRISEYAEEMRAYAMDKNHGAPDVPEGMLR